jgi:pimeloyl-ACP methyl ester carboxylesterase
VIEPKMDTLEAPGAVLHYDVWGNDSSVQPVLLLIGSPMGADGFAALARCFGDRTVVTYDPRGVERSQRADGGSGSSPDEHSGDLYRLIDALGSGPVDIFGSSGGAVNALALLARHPGQVRTLVAHEPPIAQVLPDREEVLATCENIHETYLRDGFGPAMSKFGAMVSAQGPLPDGFASQPGPDPAASGLPVTDDGSRNHPLLGKHMILCTHYQHDFAALAAAPARIVLGVGAESAATMPGRAAVGVARQLGPPPITFPGNHVGFAGEDAPPHTFAATLRSVLTP